MFCRKCGAQIPDGSGFCPKCGTPVSGAAGAVQQQRCSMYSDRRYGPFSPVGWFVFTGRMPRLELWGRCILLYLLAGVGEAILGHGISISAVVPLFQLAGVGEAILGALGSALADVAILFGVIGIILLIASGLSICARRLHDMDLSAWWVVPIELSQIFCNMPFNSVSDQAVISVIKIIIELGVLIIWMGFIPGTKGENRFGPDPRS